VSGPFQQRSSVISRLSSALLKRPLNWFLSWPLSLRLAVPFVLSLAIVWVSGLTGFRLSEEEMSALADRWRTEIADDSHSKLSSMLETLNRINDVNSQLMSQHKAAEDWRDLVKRFRDQLRLFDYISFTGVGFDNGDYIAVDRLGTEGAFRVAVRTEGVNNDELLVYDIDTYLAGRNPTNPQRHAFNATSRPWFIPVANEPNGTRAWIDPFALETDEKPLSISCSQRVKVEAQTQINIPNCVVVSTLTLAPFAEQLKKKNLRDAVTYLFTPNEIASLPLSLSSAERHVILSAAANEQTAEEWKKPVAAELLRQRFYVESRAIPHVITLNSGGDIIGITLARLGDANRPHLDRPSWLIAIAVSENALIRSLRKRLVNSLSLELSLVTCVLGVTAILVYLRVSHPLTTLTRYSEHISEAPITDETRALADLVKSYAQRTDEVGQLAGAFIQATQSFDFLLYVAQTSNEADSFEFALGDCEKRIAEFLGFAFGSGYPIQASALFAASEERSPVIRKALEESVRTQTWQPLLEPDTMMPSTDVKYGLVIPIGNGKEVFGVLEIYANHVRTIPTHLKRAVEQVMRQLARVAIRQRNLQLKQGYLEQLGHDFRSPMASIESHLTLLVESRLAEPMGSWVDQAHRKASLLVEHFEQLLEFAKLDAGTTVTQHCINLRQLIEDQVYVIGAEARKKGLEMILSVEPDVPQCLRLDPLCLKSIIGNLLQNAVKFTDAGEVMLNVSVISTNMTDVSIAIEVIDTGCGICKELQPKIFNAFERAGSTREGIGLGLYLVTTYLSLLGGRIRVESEPNKGTTVYVEMTVALPESVESVRVENESFPGTRVLLIVKGTTLKSSLTRQMSVRGMEVQSVEEFDLVERLCAVQVSSIDLLIIDAQLLRGELLNILRGNLWEGNRLIVLGDHAIAEGFPHQHLEKPVLESALFATIKTALGGKMATEPSPNVGVLVADDDVISVVEVRKALTSIFAQRISIVEATSYTSALASIQQRHFDLLITDMKMEQSSEDGVRLAHELWSRDELSRTLDRLPTPVIFLTAHPPSLFDRRDLPNSVEVLRKPLRNEGTLRRALSRFGLVENFVPPATIIADVPNATPVFDPGRLPKERDYSRWQAILRYRQLFLLPVEAIRFAQRANESAEQIVHDLVTWLDTAGATRAAELAGQLNSKVSSGNVLTEAELVQLEQELTTLRPYLEEYLAK